MRGLKVLNLLAFLHLGVLYGQTFSDASAGLPRTYAWGTSVADVNGDGRFDVLCFDATTQWQPTIYKQSETGSFVKGFTLSSNTIALTESFWADANGDGRLDLLLPSSTSNTPETVIWLQNPDETFSLQDLPMAGSPLGWADLDNDGRLDMLVADGGMLKIYWSEASGTFTAMSLPYPVGSQPVMIADLDNDRDLDLAIQVGTTRQILRNDGNRHFVDTGVFLGAGILADMNGDGLLDCIYSRNENYNWYTVMQFNEGNFRFAEKVIDTGNRAFHFIKTIDFDTDGFPDLLLVGYPKIYLNTRTSAFQLSTATFPTTVDVRTAEVADFDGDGDLDLLVVGPDTTTDPHRHLFRNNASANWSLTPPTNLAAIVSRDVAELKWEPGDLLPATFNLRIGTSPGAQDILASNSRTNGGRLIPAVGNTQTTRGWKIGKLAPGTYYWAVQAVDSGFRGSAFSTEQSFTVTEPGSLSPAPVISGLSPVFTDEDLPTRPIQFSVAPVEFVGSLSVTVESDNPTLAPASGFSLTANGTNQSLVITPGTNQNGAAHITIRATDLYGQFTTRSFVLTVAAVNDPPFIQEIPNQVTYLGAPPLSIKLQVSDAESPIPQIPEVIPPTGEDPPQPAGTVILTAKSSDQTLVADSGLKFRGTTLQVTTLTNRLGSVNITVTADDGNTETSTSFVLLIEEPKFKPAGPVLPGLNPLWADLNNDGWLDLIVDSQIYLNSSSSLVLSSNSLPANIYGSLTAFDYDRDNDLDLLMINPDAVRLLRNNGDATFTALPVNVIPKLWFPFVWPVDIDNDGDLDLLVTGEVDGPIRTLRLFLNDKGTFRAGTVPITSAGGFEVQVADLDHDGWMDLVFSGTLNSNGAPRYGVYRGIGGGKFGPLETLPPTFEALNGFGLVDINSDGWLDLWQEASTGLNLYQNRNGKFELTQTLLAQTLAWVDLDYDGDLDLFARGAFYRNDGDFQFSTQLSPMQGFLPPNVWFADANNDGAMDALLSVYNTTNQQFVGVRLYTNQSSVLNAPPSTPRNLAANVQGQQVIFSWSPPQDLNQRSGFTYNLRVGTTPGASDVLSAAALANGKLLLSAAGNAGGNTNLILTNLTREIYYWSVQAVDNSFAGGPFASEQRFFVPQPGNQPPTITDPGAVTLLEEATTQVSFTVSDDLSPLSELRVKVFPSDPDMLPSTQLLLSTTNHSDYTLKITPAKNAFGVATISIEVTDLSGGIGVRTFGVNVQNVNDPPEIGPIADQKQDYITDPFEIPFSIFDSDNSPSELQVTAYSANPLIVRTEDLAISGSGTNRLLTVKPAVRADGIANITLSVTDPAGAFGARTFRFEVANKIFREIPSGLPTIGSPVNGWGDYDNDGDLDVILVRATDGRPVIYNNDGSGQFSDSKIAFDFPNFRIGTMAWGDFDNDGDLDLLLKGRGIQELVTSIIVLENLGAGQFRQKDPILTPFDGHAEWADVDNDGDLDIISTGFDPSANAPVLTQTEIYRNNGGVFTSAAAFPGTYLYSPPLALDFNQDGFLDLNLGLGLMGPWPPALYLQTSTNGQFILLDPQIFRGPLVGWNDFNLDGYPDALATFSLGSLIFLFDPVLHSFQERSNLYSLQFVTTPDFDNDGYPDISSIGGPLLHNNQNGSWSLSNAIPNFNTSSSVSWVDLDNDLNLDLLQIRNPNGNGATFQTTLFSGRQVHHNYRPTPPRNLSHLRTADGFKLFWDDGYDFEQGTSLTYNIAIGTEPGKWDVLSPMSSTNGWRMIPALGNAGWIHSRQVKGLQPGRIYFWTVQSVDYSYAGSEFAPVQSFRYEDNLAILPLSQLVVKEDETLQLPLTLSFSPAFPENALLTLSSDNTNLIDFATATVPMTNQLFVWSLVPKTNANGNVRLSVTLDDGHGDLFRQFFNIEVQPVPDAPLNRTLHFTLPEDSQMSLPLTTTDSDGDALEYFVSREPFLGTLSPQGGGNYFYMPAPNFFGLDEFTIQATDPSGLSGLISVTVEITPVPDVESTLFTARMLNGNPTFSLRAEPNAYYVIESSTDLQNWFGADPISSESGEITFRPSDRSLPARFYRARLVTQ